MTEPPESYPRQEAATRRFRLGQPRGFLVSPAADRVAFIRSAGGRDPVGSLWVASVEADRLVERCVVDARELTTDDVSLPPAERARRERMRETTSGITAFSADESLTRAVFSLDGVPYVIDLVDAGAAPVELPHPGAAVDPRMSPDGHTVSFVVDGSVFVAPSDASAPARALCEREHDAQSWGIADFIAAEELERHRGLWWLPDSDALLVECVDESDVAVRWLADPAEPEVQPRAHRYPAAGTANPVARLFVVRLDGDRAEVRWDHDEYPYLSNVTIHESGCAIISVLNRSQTRQLIMRLDAGAAEPLMLRERVTEPWITVQSGVPTLDRRGRLLEIVARDGTFRLVADDEPLTPEGLHVTGVLDAGDVLCIEAQDDPQQHHVYRLDEAGTLTRVTPADTYNLAYGDAQGMVVATTDGQRLGVRFEARLSTGTASINSLAEVPVVTPRPVFLRAGSLQLSTAVLLPTGHQPGSATLPVILAPYGGPHMARVRRSAGAFASDQWLADQGFAVVVIDGRGTPGRGPDWEFAVAGDLATSALQDQVDGLHAVAEQYPDLDLTRVGITGWSFGGYLAALAVLDRPDVFHAAVAGAPVTDWALYDTAYSERYLRTPSAEPDAYSRTSLIARAGSLTRPLLLIHGLADDNVLAAHTLRMSSALLAAGRPHSVLPLSGVTHMTPQEVVAENLLRLEVDFLRTHLYA